MFKNKASPRGLSKEPEDNFAAYLLLLLTLRLLVRLRTVYGVLLTETLLLYLLRGALLERIVLLVPTLLERVRLLVPTLLERVLLLL
jgi:hypothetical protein